MMALPAMFVPCSCRERRCLLRGLSVASCYSRAPEVQRFQLMFDTRDQGGQKQILISPAREIVACCTMGAELGKHVCMRIL